MPLICYNGNFIPAQNAIIHATDRGFRYGDGFFETIKVANGNIVLEEFHRKRIIDAVKLLKYSFKPTVIIEKVFESVLQLCLKNDCIKSARVRIVFSNGEGDLFKKDTTINFLIEAAPHNTLQQATPLRLGVFTEMLKSRGRYAALKSTSALIYALAIRHAQENNLDECLILNDNGNIAETAIANIFWIKAGSVYTTPLSEGCIAGVLRSFLLASVKNIIEKPCTIAEIKNADEVFITNAVRGVIPVASIEDAVYTATYSNLFKTILHLSNHR